MEFHQDREVLEVGFGTFQVWPLVSERFDPQRKSFLSPLFLIAFLLKMKKAGMVAPANNPSTGQG